MLKFIFYFSTQYLLVKVYVCTLHREHLILLSLLHRRRWHPKYEFGFSTKRVGLIHPPRSREIQLSLEYYLIMLETRSEGENDFCYFGQCFISNLAISYLSPARQKRNTKTVSIIDVNSSIYELSIAH